MDKPANVLDGKTALLTGASGGLGRAIAAELAGHGCRLFLTGRDPGRLGATKAALARSPSLVQTHVADLADPNVVAQLARRAVEVMGRVDILINCAGLFPINSIKESALEDFQTCFAVNVQAPFLLCKHLAGPMAERGWGRIVNIGSSSAYAGFQNTAIYCASKHALLGLSRSLYQELKNCGVRTFCLSPGSIQTEMGNRVPGQVFETFIRPEEAAKYLVFMISFDGEMISEEVRLTRVIIQ